MDFDCSACDLYRLFKPKFFSQGTISGVTDVQILVPSALWPFVQGTTASKPITLGLKVLIIYPSVPYKYFLFVF